MNLKTGQGKNHALDFPECSLASLITNWLWDGLFEDPVLEQKTFAT